MHLSKFYNKIKINNSYYAIFNSFLMDILIVNKDELLGIESGSSTMESELKQRGIYSDEVTDSKVIGSIRSDYLEGTKDIEVMYLMLTDDCNYTCKYCYMANMEEKNFIRNNMSETDACNAVKMFGEYLERRQHKGSILFYGGEPLLRKELIKSLLVLGERYPLLEFSIITNGSLIDDEIAKLFKKHNVEVGVSLDGFKRINDENRVLVNGSGTYEKTCNGIQILEKNDCRYGLSITVSDNTIENSAAVFEWIKDFNTKNIAFNFMQFDSPYASWRNYSNSFTDFVIKAYNELEDKSIYENTIYRKLNSYSKGEIKFANCAAIGLNQITVCANGNIVICQGNSRNSTKAEINIKDVSCIEDIVNKLENSDWINRAPIMRKECENCSAIFICGGGCALQSEAIWGDANKIDETFCIFTKKMLEWMINYSLLNETVKKSL